MKWIKSPWAIGIGTTLLGSLITITYDYFKQIPFLTTFWEVVKWIGNKIIFILNFEIKVWWILCVILVIVIVIVFFNLRRGEIIKPDFCNYRKDTFKYWTWSWDWQYNIYKRAWGIINLRAYCPHCHTPLIDYSSIYGYQFECPRCEYKAFYDKCDDMVKVERIIFDNVERKKTIRKNDH